MSSKQSNSSNVKHSAVPRDRLDCRDLLVVSRPFWWVNTAAPFIASYSIIAGNLDVTLFVGVLFFAFGYNLLMYGINDIYDYETDIKNPRKIAAGIEGSVLAKTKHTALWRWMLIINLPIISYLLLSGNLPANIWLGIMMFMVAAYSIKSLRLKEIPFIDSFTSSFHYTSPFIYGGLLAQSSNLYWPAFAVFFVWVMSNHAFGAIQDIKPDRAAGVRSIATGLGASKTIVLVLAGYSVAAALPVIVYGYSGLIVSVLLLPYVVIVARTLSARHDSDSPLFRQGWRQFLYANYGVGFIFTLWLLKTFMF